MYLTASLYVYFLDTGVKSRVLSVHLLRADLTVLFLGKGALIDNPVWLKE